MYKLYENELQINYASNIDPNTERSLNKTKNKVVFCRKYFVKQKIMINGFIPEQASPSDLMCKIGLRLR
jgi:hypothetical protein